MLLVKFSLSFMVVFSAVISYLLAPKVTEYRLEIHHSFICRWYAGNRQCKCHQPGRGKGYRCNDEANSKRPVASGRMSGTKARSFAVICGLAGTMLLWHFNFLTAALVGHSVYFFMHLFIRH